MIITAGSEEDHCRSQMELSFHCPEEADLGRHAAQDRALSVAYERSLSLENTNIIRKMEQVE